MRFFLDKHIVFTVIAIANLAAVGLFWLLALLGLKQLQQTALSTSLFEKIPFIIELKPEVKAAEGLILQNWIAAHQWVKPETVQFIAKTEGLKQLQSQLGSPQLSKSGDLADSSLVFETNPLPDIIQFSMKAEYFALQKQLMDSLLTKPELQSVYTAEQIQPNVDKELNRAAKWFVVSKLWWWFLFVFCSFFVFC